MSAASRPSSAAASLLERALRFFSYVPLLGLSAVISLAKLMIYARLVPADEYGAISQIFLVGNTFGIIGSLGFYLLALRELPGLHVRRREFGMAILLTQSVIVSTLCALTASLVLVPFAATGVSSLKVGGAGLAIGLFYAWSQLGFQIVTTDARSRLEMTRYSADMAVRAIVTTAAGVAAIAIGWPAYAVVLAEIILTLAVSLWIGAGVVARTKIAVARLIGMAARRLKLAAWRAAIVLMLGSLLGFLTSAADRWLAAFFLDLKQFGYYAFAWTSIAMAQTFQFLINASLFPLISRRYWASSSREAFQLSAVLSLGLAVVGAAAAAALAPFVDMVIDRWFPQQVGAIALVEPLLIAAVLRVADFWSSFLLVIRRETLLLNLQIATLIGASLIYWVATAGRGQTPTAQSLSLLAVGLSAGNFVLCGAAAWLNRETTAR
jgi:O-antigen/teichoic acid export membrane protein